jgi:hypothetical protein
MNMLRLPVALEELMTFGLLACLNSFLKLLVVLPLKLVLDLLLLLRLVREQFTHGSKARNKKKTKGGGGGGNNRRHRRVVDHSNVVFASLIFAAICLASVDTSKIYHQIRNQSSIKLYVMFGVLEISDKLLATVGQDVLTVVFATAAGASSSTSSSSLRKPKPLAKFLFFYLLAIGYLSLHTVVLIYQTIALTVAANSYSNSLATLLLSNQFAEIKSSVFKRIDREGLFQMSCSDIVERFQLMTMLCVISLRNLVQVNSSGSGSVDSNSIGILPNSSFKSLSALLGLVLGPTMIVIGSELVVDWVKHSYITKFNKIRPKIYKSYLLLLSSDVMNNFKSMKTSSTSTNYNDNLQQRLGLPLPALFVLFIVMAKDCFTWFLFSGKDGELILFNLMTLVVLYVVVLMFKLLLELGLLKWSSAIMRSTSTSASTTDDAYVPGLTTGAIGAMDREGRLKLFEGEKAPVPPDMAEQRRKRDAKTDLGGVVRYRMASKRIW